MFKFWKTDPSDDLSDTSDASVLSSRSPSDLFKNISRKFREAEENFRGTRGGNEPVILKATEAVAIHRSYTAC
jgi:hypothetical protein